MKRGLLLIFCTLAPLCAEDDIKEEQLDKIINNPFLTKLDELNHNTYIVDKEMINNKGYNLTDIGIAFTTKHFSITGGIANLFNSFYYSFYNADSTDSVVGLAFLPAIGRSYFIQGRYQF